MSEWINPSDKLPDDGQTVIVYDGIHGIHIAKFESGNQIVPCCWTMTDSGHRYGKNIELWAALPDLPKEIIEKQKRVLYPEGICCGVSDILRIYGSSKSND